MLDEGHMPSEPGRRDSDRADCWEVSSPPGCTLSSREPGQEQSLQVFFFSAALGLRRCAWALSSCREQGLLFVAVCGLLMAVASLVAEHRLLVHGLQYLWHKVSVVVARGLWSAGSVVVAHRLSRSVACGIFPNQGSNPCPLHWQADS